MVWAYVELAVSLVLGNTGAAISGPPWSAIIADTIPLKQRGLCVMIQSWVNTFIGIFSGGIGFMVGESWSCFGRKPCITVSASTKRTRRPGVAGTGGWGPSLGGGPAGTAGGGGWTGSGLGSSSAATISHR